MPAHTLLLGFLAEQAAAMVVKSARSALNKMPWARDVQRVQTVERKIAVLVDRVATLARSVPAEGAEPLLEPMIQDFRQDLLEEKISEADANQLVDSVRAQIRSSVLRPLEDAARIVNRLETLEKENIEQEKRLAELERYRERFESDARDREKSLRTVQTLAAVALALAMFSTLLVIFATRR